MNAHKWLARPIALAVSGCFGLPVLANPTAPQVMQGTASFQGLGTNNLQIKNSPSAVIHWQGFSVDKGQLTNFVQQSASSAVLNRVVGADISRIHGTLSSNGRVFLINPAGILVGASGVIDTAGFVGSTLNMLDTDFLAGKLRFTGGPNAGSIINNGTISAKHGGSVVLVAPHIENSKDAIIQAPGGELLLAAGQKVTVGGLDANGVQFEVQAPSDSVLNLGKLIADGGLVGVFAGTLRHSGDIRAGALTRDEAGRIILKAQSDVLLAAGSRTTANGGTGGNIVIQSTNGQARVSGEVTAIGNAGRGGDIQVLGDRVSLVDSGTLDASGAAGGGQIRFGGDYQGANAALQNASRAFVGPDAVLRADAGQSGDGGRIIIWSDKTTQFYGSLSGRGGSQSGNGGFAEVSGKENLLFGGRADLGAPSGRAGSVLLDPLELFVDSRGGFNPTLIDEEGDVPGNAVTISPDTLRDMNADVTLFASRYMRIASDVTLNPGRSFSATVATYTPLLHAAGVEEASLPNQLDIGANITTAGGAINLTAPHIQAIAASTLTSGGGAITLTASSTKTNIPRDIAAGALTLNAGAGAVRAMAANGLISLAGVTGGSFIASARSVGIGPIATTGLVDLVATVGGVSTGSISTGGGALTVNAPGAIQLAPFGGLIDTANGNVEILSDANVLTGGISAGSGAVTIEGTQINTFGDVIITTGPVSLSAATGAFSTINVNVNDASSVTASARTNNANGQASINIGSTGVLNATSIVANADTPCDSNSCAGAFINLSSSGGNVNVGTVTATARVFSSFFQQLSESINVSTSGAGNSIRALSGGSQITARDVTLGTQQLNGGGIGITPAPVNVDARRSFTFSPNGEFNVNLSAEGTAQLAANVGVAQSGTYTGQLTQAGIGAPLLSVTADTAAVNAVMNIVSGFDQAVVGFNPSIDLYVPNGVLGAGSVVVPKGSTGSVPLDVTLRASGDVAVGNYQRSGAGDPDSAPKFTTIQSDDGSVTLGRIAASLDTVSVNANTDAFPAAAVGGPGNITFNTDISGAGIATGGDVFLNASGNVALLNINAGGSVFIDVLASSADATIGNVFARDVTPAPQVTAGGAIVIDAERMGTAAAPLRLVGGSISLFTKNDQGRIGDRTAGGGAVPLIANTRNLTINTGTGRFESQDTGQSAPFLVDTGGSELVNLTVITKPTATNTGGGSVTSSGTTYDFVDTSGNLTFAPSVPNTDFRDGALSLTTTQGNITLDDIALAPTGGVASLVVNAMRGSLAAGTIAADGIFLQAGSIDPGAAVSITTGAIGDAGGVRPSNVSMTAGHRRDESFGDQRSGSVRIDSIDLAAGGNLSVSTFGGDIDFGPSGGPVAGIGSSTDFAGTVLLTANRLGSGSGRPQDLTGHIRTGDIFADIVSIFGGGTDAAPGIGVGALNATNIAISAVESSVAEPQITTGAIGALRPVQRLTLAGSEVDVRGAISGAASATESNQISITGSTITVGGAITAPAPSSSVFIKSTGALTLGPAGLADIRIGDDGVDDFSSIRLEQAGTDPFRFSTLDAGLKGSVVIAPGGNAIQQTGGAGIRAANVTLGTSSPDSSATLISSTDGALDANGIGVLQLNGVKNLTLRSSGNVALDAGGATLDSFTFDKLSRTPGATTFTLQGLTGQAISIAPGPTAVTVVATSDTNPLDVALTTTVGGITVGDGDPGPGTTAGIVTRGGSVRLQATATTGAAIDTSTGIDAQGSPTPDTRGGVLLYTAGGGITLGEITTQPLARTATGPVADMQNKAIVAVTNCGAALACGINVAGNLDSGVGGGPIRLSVLGQGDITRTTGIISSDSTSSVLVTTANGNIGASGNPLVIDSPSVTLSALNASAGSVAQGNVFADLLNTTASATTNLDLTAYNGFTVTSDKPFDVLSVATRASGVDPLSLVVTPGSQVYTFARPANDLFGANANPTLEIISAAANGVTPAQPTRTTFTAIDGDLLVRSGANLTAANLKLQAADAAGSIKLQGREGAELMLTTAGEQDFIAGRHITVMTKATITGGTQTFRAVNGDISFIAGSDPAGGEAINIRATDRQFITTDTGGTGFNGDILLTAGNANGASVSVGLTGGNTNAQIEQQIQARGGIALRGGNGGDGARAEIVTDTPGTAQRQLIRAEGSISLTGGDGSNATARIANVGTGNQQVGENRCDNSGCEPYRTDSIVLQGGNGPGAGSSVEITANGAQQIQTASGAVNVLGGSATDAFARIEALGIGNQAIGGLTSRAQQIGPLRVEAGSGSGAFARIAAPNALQNISSSSTINVQSTTNSATLTAARQNIASNGLMSIIAGAVDAIVQTTGTGSIPELNTNLNQQIAVGGLTMRGGSSAGADALIVGLGQQSVSGGTVQLIGGTADGATARITGEAAAGAGVEQSVSWSTLAMTGGTANNTFTMINAVNGDQTLSGNNMTLRTNDETVALANAGAIIEGRNQTKAGESGTITLIGGTGVAGSSSDILIRNLGGTQNFRGDRMAITSGFRDSTAGIVNEGAGTQTVVADNTSGIQLTGRATGANADARIWNKAATQQTVSATRFNGPLSVVNNGVGIVDIRSEGSQAITGNGGIFVTANSAAAASITAPGQQSFNSNNGGLTVTSGAQNGAASVVSGASQTFNTGGAVTVFSSAFGNASIAAQTTQNFDAFGGINVTANSGGSASIVAQQAQTIATGGGAINVTTASSGAARIASQTTQNIEAAYIGVFAAPGALADATIAAAGNQWIRTTNGSAAPTGLGSIAVISRGPGTASIDSGARQLLEVDYPEVILTPAAFAPPGNLIIGATDSVGISRVQGVDQSVFARSITVQGGTGGGSALSGTNAQTISVLDGETAVRGGAGASAAITGLAQTIVANNSVGTSPIAISVTGGGGAGASITSSNAQSIYATRGDLVLDAGATTALISNAAGAQLVDGSDRIVLNGGSGLNSTAQITTPGAQTIMAGDLALTGGGAGLGAAALISTSSNQTISVSETLTVQGGSGSGAFARIHSDGAQAINFNALNVNAGSTSGASAAIDTPSAQTLFGGSGDINVGASSAAAAGIEGVSQRLQCGIACDITLQSNTFSAAVVNLGGAQTVSAGSIFLAGGAGGSATRIANLGAGDQSISSAGHIILSAHPSSAGSSVLIENATPSAQIITAGTDVALAARGSGLVAVTSGGTQSIDARGLDVMTQGSGNSNAAVLSAGDQTIRTRGTLSGIANTGARVVSRSQGIARIQSGGNQVLNIDGHQLVVGSLHAFVPPTAPTPADYGVGDSLIVATNAISPGSANQAITAGSLYIQGPSSDLRISKIAADTVQSITTTVGGVTLIGGSATDTFAAIDPTTQTIDSFGPVLLQGGTGRNADAFITSSGPQSITSRNGSITLEGGSGPGADALITTDSPFQNVSGMNGSGPILFREQGG